MPADVTTANLAAWQQYAATAAATEPPAPGVLPQRLEWTQVPGLGPGEELLGLLPGQRVLELGCGTGASAVLLASRGAWVTALDGAEAQIRRARRRWGHRPNLTFVCADAHDYLAGAGAEHDVVLSIFGALDFAPPARLLPRIIARLRPGGMLAVSTVHPDWSPPQHLSTETGPAIPVTRPLPASSWWPAALARLGCRRIRVTTLTEQAASRPCCLLLTAVRP